MIRKLVRVFRWLFSLVKRPPVEGSDSGGSVLVTFTDRARQDVVPRDPRARSEADGGGPENFITMG